MNVTSWGMVLFLDRVLTRAYALRRGPSVGDAISERLPGLSHHCAHDARLWEIPAPAPGVRDPHRRQRVLVSRPLPVHLLARRAVRRPAERRHAGLRGRRRGDAALLRHAAAA